MDKCKPDQFQIAVKVQNLVFNSGWRWQWKKRIKCYESGMFLLKLKWSIHEDQFVLITFGVRKDIKYLFLGFHEEQGRRMFGKVEIMALRRK